VQQGTRLFVVLPAVPNTNGGLIWTCFFSESRMKFVDPTKPKSAGMGTRELVAMTNVLLSTVVANPA